MTAVIAERLPLAAPVAAALAAPSVVHGRWTLESVRSEDRSALEALFAACSPTSIHQRFFARMTQMPRAYLDSALAGSPEVHDAVVARFRPGADDCAHSGADTDASLGIAALASLAAVPGRPDEAELGVLVADAWQGHGLGSALVGLLLDRARDRGVVRIAATVLPGRFELLAALARRLSYLGSSCTPDGLASVYMLSSPARSAPALSPRQPAGGAPCP